ncbi:MAG: hypothetical protein GF320_14795 [Armatimonadia bacterium]|jgi:hypothetical protein|nr:hypothetical protein [Armatimonadia bacterium]
MTDTRIDDPIENGPSHDETILDVIARWMHALWTWLGHTGRRIGRWIKKRARIAWVEREVLMTRRQRAQALQALGESVYKTFRDEVSGRPELMVQVDQIQTLELDLARQRRLLDKIEREELG